SAKLDGAAAVFPHGAELFESNDIDKIYAKALTIDKPVRDFLAANAAQLSPKAISEQELTDILSSSGSINAAYSEIWRKYQPDFSSRFDAALNERLTTVFADIKARNTESSDAQEPRGGGGPALRGLTPEQRTAIRRAHAEFVAALAAENVAAKAKPLTKTGIDSIISRAYSVSSIPRGVAEHYRDSVQEQAEQILRAKFTQAGVAPVEQAEAKRIIFEELVRDGLDSYIIATLIRLVPVLLIGLALGFFFGRHELFSSSFAGALAAFLLTWPIMLMWDQVVQSTWHDKKLIFLAFYAVYIVSFFLTARVGALVGIRMREGAPAHITGHIDNETRAIPLKGASWGELAANVVMGLAANAAVAAWNVVIPLNAG
ncbi:MAG: hypothetical protein KKB37_06120, partial [Alphaproteobacteria bacterium]|nr:hypothetical protein [Alphaproteobacteria bacterium]